MRNQEIERREGETEEREGECDGGEEMGTMQPEWERGNEEEKEEEEGRKDT